MKLLSSLLSLLAVLSPFEETTVRGRLLCLDEAGKHYETSHICNEPGHRFALALADKRLYFFLPNDPVTRMFTDERVQQRELQVTGCLRPENQLEIIKIRSVHNGKLYDIFFYCDICSITSFDPGLCYCCQQENEFREVPVP